MKRIKLLICLAMILVPQQMVQAQYSLKLSDEGCVNLSLAAIRTGIQQQDVAAVLTVIGPSVMIQGAEQKSDSTVAQTLTAIFDNSSSRERTKGDKALPRSVRAMESDLWDFDILSPEITVNGDSAVVECELVFWEAIPTGSSKVGSKTPEKLVFWSPFEDQSSDSRSYDPYRWKLVGCSDLFNFLASYGSKNIVKGNGGGGKK